MIIAVKIKHFKPDCQNKNICCAIFVVSNIDGWAHHTKIFSFKMKKSIVARYDYMNIFKIPSTIVS